MHRIRQLISLSLGAGFTLAGCPGAEPDCTRDVDCEAGFVCNDDRCVIDDSGEGEGEVGEGEGEGEEGEGEEGEGEEGEGEQACDANSQVCDNDRVCVGGFCDKADDGDGIPPIDDVLGCCRRVLCLSDVDCADGEQCDISLGICATPLACDPDAQLGENGCAESELCTVDAQGVAFCAPPPVASSCRLWPPRFTVVESPQRPVRFDITTLDAAGRALPHIDSDVAWGADGGAAEPTGVWTAPAACTPDVGAVSCDFVVTADVSGTSCSANVRVLDALGALGVGITRAVVVDRLSGAALANVSVVALKGGVRTTGTTDVDGIAVLAVNAPDALSAFPDDDHAWLTVMAPPADALLALDVDLVGTAAGAKGTVDFASVATVGDISFAYVGAALTDLTSFARGRFFGFTSLVNIEIEGITDPGGQLTPMTAGSVMHLGDNAIKGDFVALGEPGVGALWSLGARYPLAEVGPIISAITGGGDFVDLGSVLLEFKPPTDAAVVTNLDFAATDAPLTAPDAEAPPIGAWDLPEAQPAPHVFVHTSVDVDALELAGFSGALVFTAGVLPGAGLLPLGAVIQADVPRINDEGQQEDGVSDAFTLRSAPLHGGLEGSAQKKLVAAAFDVANSASMEGAVTVARADVGGALPAFLPLPTGTFTIGTSFAHDAAGGAVNAERFFRVVFDDGAGRTWSVWFAAPGTTVDVAALHPDDSEAAAHSVNARIESFSMGGGFVAPASYDEMFGVDGPGGRVRFLDAVDRTASLRCDGAGACAP